MAFYCENCYVVFEGKRCPVCNAKGYREPEPEDPVFLVEKEQVWSPMLQDVLEQKEIPFFCKNVNGAAMSMKIGLMSERVRFYVKMKDLDAASDVVAELYSSDAGEDEEED